MIGSDRRSLSLTIGLTLSLTLPDLNLTLFPSIPCLVSGRRSEPIIIPLLTRDASAERGDEIACRPSVRLSVRP